jgi:hypothetical protein
MLIGRIEGATRYLGAPAGWDPAQEGAECASLAIRDVPSGEGGNVMISAWKPTPEELKGLKNGASVLLHVFGSAHPPVALTVSDPPYRDAPPILYRHLKTGKVYRYVWTCIDATNGDRDGTMVVVYQPHPPASGKVFVREEREFYAKFVRVQ